MTGTIFRILIIVAIGLLLWWGLRRIWRDWRGHYRSVDKVKHQRDLEERARPDVITLQRDKDGKFRPPGDES